MRMRRFLRWVTIGTAFLLGTIAEAGMYMGTGVDVPPPVRFSSAKPATRVAPTPVTPPLAQSRRCDGSATTGKGPTLPAPCTSLAKGRLMTGPAPMVATLHSGSLKKNVEKISKQAGWGLPIWEPEYDYNWVGNVSITADNVQGIMSKLLEPYPLQAVFYEANHVVAILPRRNK